MTRSVWLGMVLLLAAGISAASDWPVEPRTRDGVATDVDPCVADYEVTTLPYSRSDDLVGAGNDCGLRASADHIYQVAIGHDGSYSFSLCGSPASTDAYLLLLRGCCSGEEITRNDDGCGAAAGPAVLHCVTLTAGTYYLVVEAGTPAGEGAYTLSAFECADPCELARVADGTYDNGDGSFTFVQTVSAASTAPAYEGPFTNPAPCQAGQAAYGFDYLCWYDNDFGWTHEWSGWNGGNVCVDSVELRICAWDVDADDCRLEHPEDPAACENDRVYLDDAEIDATYLQGSGSSWSVTTLRVPADLLGSDGELDVWVDFDEYRTQCSYAAEIHRSQIFITYRPVHCNEPPFVPAGTGPLCITDDSTICVAVTGPDPADPDQDSVFYDFDWYVSGARTGHAFVHETELTGPCVPPIATYLGDTWRVEVTAVDQHGTPSEQPWTEFFTVVAMCGDSDDVVGWDYGDLDTTCYHVTGTELSGGPANPLRRVNIAWLGSSVTADSVPALGDLDTGDDGVVFVSSPWMPCQQVCVDVLVSTGPGYTPDVQLYLYAWKDGNLDCDFGDVLCNGNAPECVIAGLPVQDLSANRATTVSVCFTDPGVFDMGQYDGVLRFRLLSTNPGSEAALTAVDPLLGETEDYIITDLQLPVTLQNFAAAVEGSSVALSWTTSSEQNNSHFLLERRAGGNWERIGGRIAGAGTSATARQYAYRDADVREGTTYEYRLIAVDLSGRAQVVATRQINFTSGGLPAVTEYDLLPNYPNPFNPSTTIAFDLKLAGKVDLRVYDLLGREVAVLADGLYAAGRHQIIFEARDLPSGVYLYRLTTDGFTAMRKMMLLK